MVEEIEEIVTGSRRQKIEKNELERREEMKKEDEIRSTGFELT